MRLAFPIVLLFASAAAAQTADVSKVQAPAPVSAVQSGIPTPAVLPPDTPVITIIGLCDNATQQSIAHPIPGKNAVKPTCKTVVTRAEFDSLAEALQPNMSVMAKAQLAGFYPKLLLLQREFRKRGLGSNPKVKEALAYARLRSEAEETAKLLKSQSGDAPPAAEIEKYYKENASTFEQVEVQRLFIPEPKNLKHQNSPPAAPAATAVKPDEDPHARMLVMLQARAAAGEDFDNLQAEVYKTEGMLGTPPKTNIGNLSVSDMPVNQRAALSLKDGEVSQVFSGANGSYIYKIVSHSTKPLDEVRGEIRNKLSDQMFAQSMEKIENSAKVELNNAYFPAGSSQVGTGSNESLLGKGFSGKSGKSGRNMRSTIPPRVLPPQPQSNPPATGATAPAPIS